MAGGTSLSGRGYGRLTEGLLFLPVDLPASEAPPGEPIASPSVPIELRLANGRCLRFPSDLDATVLAGLIHAVEAA